MGLVHAEQRDLYAVGKAQKARGQQPLRGHIHDLVHAVAGVGQGLAALVFGEGGVDVGRPHAHLDQRLHLVLHQADQRADHHSDAGQQQCRELIADGFARAGGHDRQHVLPGEQGVHHLLLAGAEGVVAENILQCPVDPDLILVHENTSVGDEIKRSESIIADFAQKRAQAKGPLKLQRPFCLWFV